MDDTICQTIVPFTFFRKQTQIKWTFGFDWAAIRRTDKTNSKQEILQTIFYDWYTLFVDFCKASNRYSALENQQITAEIRFVRQKLIPGILQIVLFACFRLQNILPPQPWIIETPKKSATKNCDNTAPKPSHEASPITEIWGTWVKTAPIPIPEASARNYFVA